MTDNTQPEAFCWATELAMVRDPVTLTVKEAREVSDEMQRMHAENETLRAGYAAARLEIESLRSQAPHPSPAAQGDALDAARYRYLRDVPMDQWPAELLTAIRLQQNAKWDAAIDAARAAQESKSHD